MSNDGKYVFVGSEYQTVAAADTAKHEQHKGMPMSMTGAGTGLGTLTVVCAATRKDVASIPVGKNAAGIGTTWPKGPLPAPTKCR